MKLEDVCEDIEKVLKDIYGTLKETDKASADDTLKLATGLIHDQNIFFGEDIAFLTKKALYDRAVDKGERLELLQMHFQDLLFRICDAIESIHDEKTSEKTHYAIVDILKDNDKNLQIHNKVYHNVRSRRLVVYPIREIVGKGKGKISSGDLEIGHSYLFLVDRPDKAFGTFANYVKAGYHGLCISRYFPMKIRKKYSLEKTPMLWLSHTDSEESHLDPSNLGVLTNILRDFFEKTEKGIVMLEGLEYLIIQNGFDTVLRFIQYLNEHVVTNKVILIVPFNEEALEKKEMALLKAELEVVD